jgi:hypothetical protein
MLIDGKNASITLGGRAWLARAAAQSGICSVGELISKGRIFDMRPKNKQENQTVKSLTIARAHLKKGRPRQERQRP